MPTPAIAIKRSYEAREPGDGRRVLVDRLWPRGLTKAAAGDDDWVKQVWSWASAGPQPAAPQP